MQPSLVENNTYSGYYKSPELEAVPDNGLQKVAFVMVVTDEVFNPNVTTDISHISFMTIKFKDGMGNDYKQFKFFCLIKFTTYFNRRHAKTDFSLKRIRERILQEYGTTSRFRVTT